MRTRSSLVYPLQTGRLVGMHKWLARAFRKLGISHSQAKRCSVLYVRSRVVERNPALLASIDSTLEDYSMFRDVLVLTETSEYIRVIIKSQEFWLPKPMVKRE